MVNNSVIMGEIIRFWSTYTFFKQRKCLGIIVIIFTAQFIGLAEKQSKNTSLKLIYKPRALVFVDFMFPSD